MNSITLQDLKNKLIELEIELSPFSKEKVNQRKAELGGMPKQLEDYFLTIGWFDEISDSGMGCHMDDLDDLKIETSDQIKKGWKVVPESANEKDDYLLIGRESVSVCEFFIKVKDFDMADPTVYTNMEGYPYQIDEDCDTLSKFFDLIALSAEEA